MTHNVDTNLRKINARLAERRIVIHVTDRGKEWLARNGFDPVYGARPLRRLVQSTIEDQLATKLLAGEIIDGAAVTFDVDPDTDQLRIG